MSDSPSTGAVAAPDAVSSGIVRTLIVLAGLVAAALVVNLAATLATVSAVGSDVSQPGPFVVTTVGSELAFLAVGAAFIWRRSSFRLPIRAPTRSDLPYLLGGLIASVCAAGLSLALTDAVVPAVELSPGYAEYSPLDTLTGPALAAAVVVSLLVIGPAEEFLFRGVIQGRLAETFDPGAAVGVAGVVFGLFHVYPVALLSPPPAALVHMAAYYTLMGAIFGWVYHRTDTLVGPAVVHGVFNAALFAVAIPG